MPNFRRLNSSFICHGPCKPLKPEHANVERMYIQYLPSNYEEGEKFPVVIDFQVIIVTLLIIHDKLTNGKGSLERKHILIEDPEKICFMG